MEVVVEMTNQEELQHTEEELVELVLQVVRLELLTQVVVAVVVLEVQKLVEAE